MAPQPPSGPVRIGYRLVTFLLALSALFAALSVVSVGVGIARHGDSLLYGRTLGVEAELSPDEVRPLPPGIRLRGSPRVAIEVSGPTTKQMLLRHATDLGPLVLFVLGLWLLRGLARSVLAGDPFGPANVRRLRSIGFLLVLGGPAVALVNWSLRMALFNDLPAHRSAGIGVAGFGVPPGVLLGGLGAFVLAEVFAHGVRLREDVEGTV